MKNLFCLGGLAVSLVLSLPVGLTAQSLSDGFSSGVNWSAPWKTDGNGVTTFSNGRLEFTINAGKTYQRRREAGRNVSKGSCTLPSQLTHQDKDSG